MAVTAPEPRFKTFTPGFVGFVTSIPRHGFVSEMFATSVVCVPFGMPSGLRIDGGKIAWAAKPMLGRSVERLSWNETASSFNVAGPWRQMRLSSRQRSRRENVPAMVCVPTEKLEPDAEVDAARLEVEPRGGSREGRFTAKGEVEVGGLLLDLEEGLRRA